MANFFDSLREKSVPVKIQIEEQWLLYSLDNKRSEEILSTLVDVEDDDTYSITLLRRNGITAAERKKCGDMYKKQEETRRQYDSLLQACARLHQIPESDIGMLINVQLRSEIVKLLIETNKEKYSNVADESKLKDDFQEKSREMVKMLGEDFQKLCEFRNAADEAFLDYRYELGAYMLSSPLRVKNLEGSKNKLKLTKEDLRELDQNLINKIYTDFINKEEGGADAWDNVVRRTFAAKFADGVLTPAEEVELVEGATYQIESVEIRLPEQDDDLEGNDKTGN
jgi:hypothetical protein